MTKIYKYLHKITAWLQSFFREWFDAGPSSVYSVLEFNCGEFDDIKPAIGLLQEYPRMQREGMLEISLTKNGVTYTGERAVNMLLDCYYSNDYALRVKRETTVEENDKLKSARMSMHFNPNAQP